MRFSFDELRALRGVAGIALPRFVSEKQPPAVDVAALRGLAARDLVTLLPAVRLSAELTSLFTPCQDPDLVAEIEVESGDVVARSALVGTVRFTEEPAGLVSVQPEQSALVDLLGLDELTGGGDLGFSVDTDAFLAADDLAHDDAAVRLLTAAGAPADAARGWIDAVRGRHRTVSVALARDLGGRYVAAELCWVVAGDGTAWRVSTDPGGGPPDGPTVTTVRQVAAATLRDGLAEVLVPAEVLT